MRHSRSTAVTFAFSGSRLLQARAATLNLFWQLPSGVIALTTTGQHQLRRGAERRGEDNGIEPLTFRSGGGRTTIAPGPLHFRGVQIHGVLRDVERFHI